ncbi:hypothetical protein ID854_01190 [Xenorhabdus sp. M]|uniref:Uncharacterized protein n=1 Tax=Xenorhabdus szentirmaii TaxID=290112 RepID=A0AAW3YS41_9GAMM|nr:hypothetical protein [Xenorhabdus sp. M]MBD2799108.1 hypothetical protein [Xenorhabdus sp. M]
MDPSVAEQFELPTTFRVDDGYAEDISDSKNLAEMLLNIAVQFENKSKITYARKVFKRAPCRIRKGGIYQYTSCQERRYTETKDIGELDPDKHVWKCPIQVGLYKPEYWSGNYARANNCYAYACNIRMNPASDFNWPHPGYFSKERVKISSDDQELLDGVKNDGIVKYADGMNCPTSSKDEPVWLTLLFSGLIDDQYWDYHWYRCIKEGNRFIWAHKMGPNPIEKIDTEKVEAVKANAEINQYTRFHGDFLIPKVTIFARARP